MNQDLLANTIKNLRKKNNLTQEELAKKLNVTYQAVSKWENGKSMPDIDTLKNICSEFNISLDYLIGTPKKKFKKAYILMICLIVIIGIGLLFLLLHKDSFEFKTLSTTCSEFSLSGSAAYSKDKTSLYISNIDYCGENDNTSYNNIVCSLYEKSNNNISLISECKSQDNITLKQYLKDLQINVDNYNSLCKKISSSDIYLEIKATDDNNKIIEYTIPLTFNDNC